MPLTRRFKNGVLRIYRCMKCTLHDFWNALCAFVSRLRIRRTSPSDNITDRSVMSIQMHTLLERYMPRMHLQQRRSIVDDILQHVFEEFETTKQDQTMEEEKDKPIQSESIHIDLNVSGRHTQTELEQNTEQQSHVIHELDKSTAQQTHVVHELDKSPEQQNDIQPDHKHRSLASFMQHDDDFVLIDRSI